LNTEIFKQVGGSMSFIEDIKKIVHPLKNMDTVILVIVIYKIVRRIFKK
jgi:hypothetical protein